MNYIACKGYIWPHMAVEMPVVDVYISTKIIFFKILGVQTAI